MSKSLEKKGHAFYLLFLVFVGVLAMASIGINGFGYYLTPEKDRPFHPQYDDLKPSGVGGHGYGIIGSLMISFGVVLYSSRKRLRVLANAGKVKHFLEFHIFLCVVGPILILYHTTFKFGGLVAVSFWSMTAVVLSGVIGRYFYVQIPRGIQGNELSVVELMAENEKINGILRESFGLSPETIEWIDAIATPPKMPAHMSLLEVINFFILNDLTRRRKLHAIYTLVRQKSNQPDLVKRLGKIAVQRITLMRRIAFLQQFRQIFHYWHVIHLPFSIVMFVVLIIHVGVAIAFGYRWIL